MALTDPIADMLARIKNGISNKQEQVDLPNSRLKLELAKILKAEGFIKNYKVIQADKKDQLRIFLKYDGKKQSAIVGLERVSRSSRRMYVGATEIPTIRGGLGVMILSTNQGLVTDQQARKLNVGGELICKVW